MEMVTASHILLSKIYMIQVDHKPIKKFEFVGYYQKRVSWKLRNLNTHAHTHTRTHARTHARTHTKREGEGGREREPYFEDVFIFFCNISNAQSLL